ncbi:MAG: Holliday junction branch migration protein RuvA [bacterium]|nr:Holliday junction branch migration protein RuvA [bacterium]
MIGFLSGTIHSKEDMKAIINVSGVGYDVLISQTTLAAIGEAGDSVRLEIYTHVNESTFQLFGFQNTKEKKFFQKLISVSGVGPKLALTMLSAMPLYALAQALAQGNLATLTSISGVGKKTAERLVVELKDKFKDEIISMPLAANDETEYDFRLADVTSALMTLGYPENYAKKAVNGLEIRDDDTVQSLIKKSLVRIQK